MLTTLATLVAVSLTLQQGEGRGEGRGQGGGSGDTTVAVQSGARLDVNNFGGEIVVHTWNQNNVKVRSSHSSRSRVDVSTSASTVLVRTAGRRGPPSIVDLDITVPTWMAMSLSGTYTDISVDGAAGDITVESVDGDIILARIDAVNIDVNTVDGDITYDGTIKTSGSYRLATHDGDVAVVIPPTACVSGSVSTFDGDFDASFTVDTVRAGKHRFSFTIGRCASPARLEVETFDGDIKLRRPGEVEIELPGHKGKNHDNDNDNDFNFEFHFDSSSVRSYATQYARQYATKYAKQYAPKYARTYARTYASQYSH